MERCHQYIEEIPEEDLDAAETTSTPYGWPSEGIVNFKDVNFRYRDHLPLVLKQFNFETKSKEKVYLTIFCLSPSVISKHLRFHSY